MFRQKPNNTRTAAALAKSVFATIIFALIICFTAFFASAFYANTPLGSIFGEHHTTSSVNTTSTNTAYASNSNNTSSNSAASTSTATTNSNADSAAQASASSGSDATQNTSTTASSNANNGSSGFPFFSFNQNGLQSSFSKIGKDYICAGYDVEIENGQRTECNLIATAKDITLGSAQIAGDAILAAETINAQGTNIANNLFAVANNANINATITNETSIIAKNVNLSGAQRWVHVWADTVVLSGNFSNVDVFAAHIIVKSDAIITGKLNVKSSNDPQIETGARIASVNYEKGTDTITSNISTEIGLMFSLLFTLLGTFVCGLLLLAFFRTRPFDLCAQRFCKSPARVLLTGLLTCILVPIIACILLILLVGIRAMLILVAFAFCLGLLSLPFTALALSRKIFKKLNKWLGAILMLVIVGVLACVPYLRIAIDAFCTLFTVGSVVVCFFDWKKSVKQAENNTLAQSSTPTDQSKEQAAKQTQNSSADFEDIKDAKNADSSELSGSNTASLAKIAAISQDLEDSAAQRTNSAAKKADSALKKAASQNATQEESAAAVKENLAANKVDRAANEHATNKQVVSTKGRDSMQDSLQFSQEDLSQAEAILAELARKATLAQSQSQAQSQAQVQENESAHFQEEEQHHEQTEKQPTRRNIPKLDRDAQVKAILARLQEKQDDKE